MPSMIMILGAPASGKSSIAKNLVGILEPGTVYLNRDTIGGTIAQLILPAEQAIVSGQNVVLDNLFPTVESRKPFIDVAKKHGVDVNCMWVKTSIEDATINALHRMWQRYGKLFLTTDSLKEVKKDSNMFPIVVLYKYKKEFQKPTKEEGFTTITQVEFIRTFPDNHAKAIIFDYDQTLRDVRALHEYAYPLKPNDVILLPKRREIVKAWRDKGYLMLGASNQSGVAKGVLTNQDAVDCFDETNRQLGVNIDYQYCPHNVPPTCYCRKPASGMGVYFIEKYALDPRQCIFVGDQTTDKTFAERLSFQYVDQSEFFK